MFIAAADDWAAMLAEEPTAAALAFVRDQWKVRETRQGLGVSSPSLPLAHYIQQPDM